MNELMPYTSGVLEGIDAAAQVLNTLTECVKNHELQETQREQIRAQAKVAIKQIESDNSKYMERVNRSHEERMRMIQAVETILSSPTVTSANMPEVMDCCITMLNNVKVGRYEE